MAVLIATFTVAIVSLLATLACYNYLAIMATNNRSDAYYLADQGMEKTLKNLETIIESGKIYANEKLRSEKAYIYDTDKVLTYNTVKSAWVDNLGNTVSPLPAGGKEYISYYEYLTSDCPTADFTKNYKRQFETYYIEFMNDQTNGIKCIDDDKNPTNGTYDNKLVSADSELIDGTKFILHPLDIANTNYASLINGTASSTTKTYIDSSPLSSGNPVNYNLDVNVTGWRVRDSKAVFVRKVYGQIGVSPWGYSSTAGGQTVTVQEDKVYSSPQWANAIASSGDVVVTDGAVNVYGDVYVNGKFPGTPNSEGKDCGGLIVGKDDGNAATPVSKKIGALTVNGNIFTNNYVHTMYPGSTINVNKRVDELGKPTGTGNANYSANIEKIYKNSVKSTYSELASNLNTDGVMNYKDKNGTIINSIFGSKQSNQDFIDYIKSTYTIQKKYGGFIYANNIQMEEDAIGTSGSSQINVAGSAVVFDNLEADGVGQITIDNNFYGFRDGVTGNDYNQSSSIIINNSQAKIYLKGRIYNAGIAYVTAKDASGAPYKTGEAISLFKNYYAYRNPLEDLQYYDEDEPDPTKRNKTFATRFFDPFNFTFFSTHPDSTDSNLRDSETFEYKYAHIFKYDEINIEDTFSEGGTAYDKNMMILNASIYNDSNINTTGDSGDMGYTRGVLVGQNTSGGNFMAIINPGTNDPPNYNGVIKKSLGSLNQGPFDWYIKDKYATLMEVKALKAIDNSAVTINDLVKDNISAISGWHVAEIYKDDANLISGVAKKNASYDANFIIANGDVSIGTDSSGHVLINYGTGTPLDAGSSTFNGIIFATGTITVSTDSNIVIDGALISSQSTNNVGVQFSGAGTKTIKYDKQKFINIFRLPNSETSAVAFKNLMTTKRGIVEMFNKLYGLNTISGFKAGIDDITADGAVTANAVTVKNSGGSDVTIDKTTEARIITAANLYEIVDSNSEMSDKTLLSSDILNNLISATGKNYKIMKWKTIQ